MKTKLKFLAIIALVFSTGIISAQSPPYCPSVMASGVPSNSLTVPPSSTVTICAGECANLTASVIPVNQTNSYTVVSVPFNTYVPTGPITPAGISGDDYWSPVINLPFCFSFYGNTFNQCIIGTNGQISFNLANANGGNNWSISNPIPSLANLPGNTICCPYRDYIVPTTANLRYYTSGTAPCRAFVVEWTNIQLFSCINPLATFQCVLFENTNYIDVNVTNSSGTCSWNSSRGILGIQNATGTSAVVPPNRNMTPTWTAINESWRFIPTGTPQYTVNWIDASGAVVGTGTTLNVCPLSTSNYTASMNVASCNATLSPFLSVVTVSVRAAGPTLTVNTPSICIGGSTVLTVSGATNYTWTPSGLHNASIAQSPTATTAYTITGSVNSNGCLGFQTTTLTVFPLPNVTGVSSGNVCQNQPLVLSGSGAVSYNWSGPNNFSSSQPTISFSQALLTLNGTFTVTGTDIHGCVNTNTLSQTVYTLPVPYATGSTACFKDPLTLSVTPTSQSYQWIGPNGYTSSLQSPVIASSNFGNIGTYTAIVTSVFGCTASATANCDVYALPAVGFSGNTELCKGQTFSFLGNGALNYKWLATFGVVSLENSISVSSSSGSLQTTYTLVGADANGCLNSVVINPIVLQLPTGFIEPQKQAGCAPFCTTYKLTNTSANIVTSNWNFDNGIVYNDSTSVKECLSAPGIHTVTINMVNNKGCKGSITNTVEVYPLPHADFVYSPDTPTENDYNVTFTDITSSANIQSWYWDFYSNGKDTSIKQNPTFSFPNIGNYFVFLKVKSDHGCVDSLVKKLTVNEDVTFFVPNSFTPNGDGNNETFMPKAVGVKKFQMDIFDRWGQLLYSTNDIEKGWDGKTKKGGDVLSADVYVYKITVTQSSGKPKQYIGHVTLIK